MASASEIERKYLLPELPEAIAWDETERIRQGYLALDGDVEVRVRLRQDRSGLLTVKSGGGRVRLEEELPIEPEMAQGLWPLTEGRRVEKTRRRSRLDGMLLEVDEYEGDLAGLLVAEVEFPDEESAERFSPPDWFAREVTDDAGFKNRSLACHGIPEGAA